MFKFSVFTINVSTAITSIKANKTKHREKNYKVSLEDHKRVSYKRHKISMVILRSATEEKKSIITSTTITLATLCSWSTVKGTRKYSTFTIIVSTCSKNYIHTRTITSIHLHLVLLCIFLVHLKKHSAHM